MIACYVGTNFPNDYFVTYPKDYIHPYLGVHGGTHTHGMQAFACVLPFLAGVHSPLAIAPVYCAACGPQIRVRFESCKLEPTLRTRALANSTNRSRYPRPLETSR